MEIRFGWYQASFFRFPTGFRGQDACSLLVFGAVWVQVCELSVDGRHEEMAPPPRPRHTYVLSHSGAIQAGAEKLGIGGSVRGRLGTLGRGTLARLLVNDLPSQSRRRG